jgi:hypothetical protein
MLMTTAERGSPPAITPIFPLCVICTKAVAGGLTDALTSALQSRIVSPEKEAIARRAFVEAAATL